MDRTLVPVRNVPQRGKMALSVALTGRSEGVRMPFGKVRKVEKVQGVGSWAKFLVVSYIELAEMLAKSTGYRYGKSTIGTWAMAEHPRKKDGKKHDAKWYKQYWMPVRVEAAFKKMIRDYIHWATDGRYAVRVTGKRHWKVTLRRV